MRYKNAGKTFFRSVTNYAFDRQTDKQTEISSLDRVWHCFPCSAVKRATARKYYFKISLLNTKFDRFRIMTISFIFWNIPHFRFHEENFSTDSAKCLRIFLPYSAVKNAIFWITQTAKNLRHNNTVVTYFKFLQMWRHSEETQEERWHTLGHGAWTAVQRWTRQYVTPSLQRQYLHTSSLHTSPCYRTQCRLTYSPGNIALWLFSNRKDCILLR